MAVVEPLPTLQIGEAKQLFAFKMRLDDVEEGEVAVKKRAPGLGVPVDDEITVEKTCEL